MIMGEMPKVGLQFSYLMVFFTAGYWDLKLLSLPSVS